MASVNWQHPAFIAAFSAAVLGAAFIFQQVYNTPPCTLCQLGRAPWFVIAVWALLVWWITNTRQTGKRFRQVTPLVFIIAALSGIAISLYHAAGENALIALTCAGKPPEMPLRDYIDQVVDCSVPTLGPFAIPLTAYNTGLYSALIAFVLLTNNPKAAINAKRSKAP